MSEREQLEQAIAAQESLRATLGDAVVDATIAILRQQLDKLEREAERAPALEGERKLVTILFADISGYTALAETMDPEAVRDLMNMCFEWLVPVIERYGGTVDKFTGDGIMALFGAPVTHENDAERALRTALEMRQALTTFNRQYETNLGVHFGVNSGLVIAGGIGTRERQEYSVMGDAVNLAARLEDLSAAGEVLVGPDTHRLTAPLFDFEALAPILVKGRSEPAPVYRLLAAKAVPGKVRGIAGLESELVGRGAEFAALRAAVERVQAGEGSVVTLVGEAGLGKSRLVSELQAHCSPSRDGGNETPLWVEGRCLSYGSSLVYLLWLDILRDLLRVSSEDLPDAVDAQLRQQVQELCPERLADVYPYLARLMALPMAAEFAVLLQNVDGERLKSGVFFAVECLLEGMARRRPLVVVCEDLHWSDVASLELLVYLMELTTRAPILFLCLFRPEREHASWKLLDAAAQDGVRHVDVWLEPLTSDESKTLVGNLLRVEGLPAELRERILSHSEGNPFYVEEIIRSLLDDGAIERDPSTNQWVATREVASIAIPDTLHGVLMARIDRLEDETKRVLQLASVIGRIFFYRVLAAIAQEERALDTHLSTLQKEEMIRERVRQPELEYIFKHHLTQEAAYNGLLKKDRRAFHRQVAEALECLFPERIDEQIGLLAYHWEQAEEAEKATHYLLRAGDQARMVYAHHEAIDYYERALVLMRQADELKAQTLIKLGLTYHMVFDFQRSRLAYQEGFALRQRIGEQQNRQLPPAPHALRMIWGTEPPTLNPTLAEDATSVGLIEQLFSGLVHLTPEMNVIPDVAQSWEVQDSGRKFVFTLRDDVFWSDGTPVTAQDFVCAWQRALDPQIDSPAASILYDVKGARAFHRGEGARDDVGVRALDDLSLAVELEEPTGYFLHLLTYTAFYPIPRHVAQCAGNDWLASDPPVTNGPFQLARWEHGQSMVLERNPTYHGQLAGNVERIELELAAVPPAKALETYERGELDIVGLPSQAMDRAREKHPADYVSFSLLNTMYIGFNVSRPPFDRLEVRRALAMSIDKEMLAAVVLKGYVSPANGGFIPPQMPGHSADIGLPFDPARARQLLVEVGYPGGKGFPAIQAARSQGNNDVGDLVQAQWRENLGLEIDWQALPWAPYIESLRENPPHIFTMAWAADYPDPDNYLRVGLWRERVKWNDETYVDLVERARRVADQRERMALYRQADQILIESAVIVPLFYAEGQFLVQPWVTKFHFPAIGGATWKDFVIEPHD